MKKKRKVFHILVSPNKHNYVIILDEKKKDAIKIQKETNFSELFIESTWCII